MYAKVGEFDSHVHNPVLDLNGCFLGFVDAYCIYSMTIYMHSYAYVYTVFNEIDGQILKGGDRGSRQSWKK